MAKATLTTLTPVHVGSGQTLKKGFDFISVDRKIGFLDLDKVSNLIGIENIPLLTSQIEKGKSIMDLPALRSQPLEAISSIVADSVKISYDTQELKTHYRTSLHGICIPGSSIKGSIKTALFEILTTSEFLQKMPIDDFGKIRFNKKTKIEERVYKDGAIETKLFGLNANEKSTRFIKIGDCSFTEAQKSSVFEVGIYNLTGKEWKFKPERLLVEAIPKGSKANFTLKLDDDWLAENKRYYPQKWSAIKTDFVSEGLLSFCRRMNDYESRQIAFELRDLKDYNFGDGEYGETMLETLEDISQKITQIESVGEESFILRLGGHNGWNFTTGGWMKKGEVQDKLSKEDYDDLRLFIQKKDRLDIELWPKTRKMTTDGIPLGFVKITFLKS